jgi:hypothetical protein
LLAIVYSGAPKSQTEQAQGGKLTCAICKKNTAILSHARDKKKLQGIILINN